MPRSRWVVAGWALAFVLGAAGAVLVGDDDRLRVNGSDVAQAVWEAKPEPSAAPRCSPRTADGIGAWHCSIRYTGPVEGFAPDTPRGVPKPPMPTSGPRVETAELTVTDRGRVEGSLAGLRFDSCCIRVR